MNDQIKYALFFITIFASCGSIDEPNTSTEDASEEDASEDVFEDTDHSDTCSSYNEPETVGRMIRDIVEVSGMIQSSFDPNVFWVHNDSGGAAELYAITLDETLIATIQLENAVARDWEDISLGPCSSSNNTNCIYIGDIGDNDHRFGSVSIYRFVEPDPSEGDQTITNVETGRFNYPNGPQNAEALIVDQDSNIWILTKKEDSFDLFTATFTANETVSLSLENEIQFDEFVQNNEELVTGADFNRESKRLLVRTYSSILEYRLSPEQTLHNLDQITPLLLPSGEDEQGEAITYGQNGYYHVSEGGRPPIWFVGCLE